MQRAAANRAVGVGQAVDVALVLLQKRRDRILLGRHLAVQTRKREAVESTVTSKF